MIFFPIITNYLRPFILLGCGLVVILLNPATVCAQQDGKIFQPEISITTYGTPEGLSFSGLKALTRDSTGYLWLLGEDQRSFGERTGLRLGVYDGVRFRSRALGEREGLWNNTMVESLSLWGPDSLLIIPKGSDHLYGFDIRQERSFEIRYDSGELDGIRTGAVWNDRFCFIFTPSSGQPALAVWDGSKVQILFTSPRLANAFRIFPGQNGIWVCGAHEILLYDWSGNVLKSVGEEAGLTPYYVPEITPQGLVILPHGGAPFVIDPETLTSNLIRAPFLDKMNLASRIEVDGHGNVLYVFSHPFNLQYLYLQTNDGRLFDLSHVREQIPQVADIHGDNFLQSFWVVNAFNLYKVELSGTSISHFLLNAGMRKIQLGQDGNLYACTETGGTFVSPLAAHLDFRQHDNYLFNRYFKMQEDNTWFTNNESFFYYTRQGKQKELVLNSFPNDITAVDDSLLFASCTRNAEIIHVNGFSSEVLEGSFFESTHQVLQSGPGRVFIAYREGVAEMNLDTRQTQSVLSGQTITSLKQDPDGSWWFGGIDGRLLHFSHQKTDTLLELGTSIVSITADGQGRLWLGTLNGVYVFHPMDRDLFKIEDRLLTHPECNRLSAFYDSVYNRMMIGTVRGLNVIDINGIDLAKPELTLSLSYLHLYNRSENQIDTLLFRNVRRYQVSLDAYHRNLTVGFSPGISGENKCLYYYALVPAGRINSHEISWLNNGTNAEISLSNLKSGHYTLLIKSKVDLSERESVPVEIDLFVADYFYNQGWFYALILAGLVVMVLARQRRLKKENIRLEKEVDKRTAELKKDKETIQKQAEELTKLDEMKTRFFNNISHELKTPLSLIVAPLASLKSGNYIQDQKGNEFLRLIAKNATHLKDRVEELLELARLEHRNVQVHLHPVDMKEFVENHCLIFRQEAERSGIEWQVTTDFSFDRLVFDEKKAGKVLQNLIANALKYCPSGSRVRVEVETDGQQLRFCVEDNGPGIPLEHQPRIYDKFYQVPGVKSPSPGSGIGLSIVKEYVDLMGGRIDLKASAGKGSRFEIHIPVQAVLEPAGELQAETTQKIFNPPLETAARLLVVEDNEDLRHFLSLILARGFHLTMASNGVEAIRLLENGLEVDLILSDIMMPQLDGLGLLEYVKSRDRFRKLPFIFLTARHNEGTRLSALRMGVDDYLTKPFLEEELLLRIHRLLQHYQIRRSAEKASPSEHFEPVTAGDSVLELQQFVREHLTDPTFSVDTIAAKWDMSERSLRRYMQREIGMSPKDFIIEVQMNLLRELRAEKEELTLRELAAMVGYTDHKYMSKVFFERFGYRL